MGKNSLFFNDLDLDRFTESCKIEIHGCSTAGKTDNFALSL